MNELMPLLRAHLRDWRSGWSMGSFGAIAEFHQDEGEPTVIAENGEFQRATRRGAIRFCRETLPQIAPIAYETLSPKPRRWSQALALCLPAHAAMRARNSVLTELGPDDNAIREIDRMAILFDMGLSLSQCDFCIRTSDRALLGVLRANLGRSMFDPENTAMHAILAAHPHRVALTNIGRIEVYQKIGGPETGGVSPPGPHTHLLPKLLRSGRAYSATTPIPDGLMPLGYLHPGNPVIDETGRDHAFDPELYAAFQKMLEAYGAPPLVAVKRTVGEAIRRQETPRHLTEFNDRFERAAFRLALRQQIRLAESSGDPAFRQSAESWMAYFESRPDNLDEEDDAPGH